MQTRFFVKYGLKFMAEIYFKSENEINLARTPIKIHKCHNKWPLFVKLFWWFSSITLDNNNDDF